MTEEILFTLKSPYRDDFKIRGFRFGCGEKSVAIVGAMRGNEVQQQFTCSQVVKNLLAIEKAGKLIPGHEILIIPSANHFSMNINKRFWAMDNTDINRMFPGYDKGETTQRIAAAIFENVRGYKYGIQLASFYMPGDFIPHVRMMDTGFQNVKLAKKFGLPFVMIRKPLPYDTAVLNYNWQVFDTQAFSIYSGDTDIINKDTAKMAWLSILRFLHNMKIIDNTMHEGYTSCVIKDANLETIISNQSGILYGLRGANDEVKKGDILAKILDPFTGEVRSEIISPLDGTIFFAHQKPLVHHNTVMFKIVRF
ncbi:MAG: succinylglutamate desuccinylase [Porphyromonadaceae bacterium CG2_30_38_12]|nr:MAG: succinylglutamate desuccinylase [Porphyromonadaceae bacterium CG2_30_38_12]